MAKLLDYLAIYGLLGSLKNKKKYGIPIGYAEYAIT
jgi:hypothetical protein